MASWSISSRGIAVWLLALVSLCAPVSAAAAAGDDDPPPAALVPAEKLAELASLGQRALREGERALAQRAAQTGVDLLPRLDTGDLPGAYRALLGLEQLTLQLGLPALRRPVLERAWALARVPPSPDLRETWNYLVGECGNQLKERGDHAGAAACFEALDAVFPGSFDVQISLASCDFLMGELLRCEDRLLGLLAQPTLEPDQRSQARMTLALVDEEQGEYELAAVSNQELFVEFDRAGQPSVAASCLVNEGRALRLAGAHGAAAAAFALAADLATEAGGEGALGGAYDGLARIAAQRGELVEAHSLAACSLEVLEAAGQAEHALSPLRSLVELALRTDDLAAAAAWLDAARAVLDRPGVTVLDTLESAGVRSRFTGFGECEQDLTARRVEACRSEARDAAEVIRDGWARLGFWRGRALLERLPEAPGGAREPPGALVERLAAGLGSSLLIEYAAGSERLYAYVLDPMVRGATGAALQFVDLGPRQPIEQAARDYVHGLAAQRPLAEVLPPGRRLHELLVAGLPGLHDAQGAGRPLLVVPTPDLAGLPFEALVSAAPERPRSFRELRFLLDEHVVGYAPSSPVLAALMARAPRPPARALRALIVGDPLYPGEEEAAGRRVAAQPRLAALGRLPGAGQEALLLAEMLTGDEPAVRDALLAARLEDRRHDVHVRGAAFELFLGDSATPACLGTDQAGVSLLHLGAHALVDPEDPLRGGLALSAEPGQPSPTLFGLDDVLALQLDADLVVLSACETARGRVLAGEGVQSLANGFLQAGARAVVASLWPVTDSATSSTMSAFYRGWLREGLPVQQALTAARRQMRAARRERGGLVTAAPELDSHPYLWAAFVHIGAPD